MSGFSDSSVCTQTRPHVKVKKGFNPEVVGLPFPNYALGKTELPAICHCIFDGDHFYVSNDKDMHTLHQNGAFGVSSLTNRGLSYNDPDFYMKPYYQKQFNERERGSRNNMNTCHSNGYAHQTRNDTYSITKSSCGIKKAKLELFDSNGCVPKEEKSFVENGNQYQSTSMHANGCQRKSMKSLENSKPKENIDYAGFESSCKGEELLENILRNLNFEDERLILMPEEAIFLSFGIGCLSIHNPGGDKLGYRNVWQSLVESNPEFPISYAVYHYFRSKNWVPKLADSYGAAYVLYEVGPAMHHSSYIVQIIGLPSRPIPTWNELHAWMRLACQANKSLLLCEVSLPVTFNAGISEPRSIFQMTLKETSLFRWVPKHEEALVIKS